MYVSSKVSLFLAVLLIFSLGKTEAQDSEIYKSKSVFGLALDSGIQIGRESGFEPLPQATIRAMAIIGFGAQLQIMLETGFYRAFPSIYSNYWYRYRGFSALNSLVGLSYHLGHPDLYFSVYCGGTLARYDYSYSYFFYPQLEPRLEVPLLVTPKIQVNIGMGIPVHFRADITSMGIEARISFLKLTSRKPRNPE
jgi:hypothetical protein